MQDSLAKHRPKKFRLGLIHGRFQSITSEHVRLYQFLIQRCEKVILMIGSSQKGGTELNPFTYEERAELIQKALGPAQIVILPAPDIFKGVNRLWGQHLIKIILENGFPIPEVTLSSEDTALSDIFEDFPQIKTWIIPRSEISATRLREAILQDNYAALELLLPKGLFESLPWQKKRLLDCQGIPDSKVKIIS